jgi:hypothetical protein
MSYVFGVAEAHRVALILRIAASFCTRHHIAPWSYCVIAMPHDGRTFGSRRACLLCNVMRDVQQRR